MMHLSLGASLYIPANRYEWIVKAVQGVFPELKSVIIDFEDSITSEQLVYSYENIQRILKYVKEVDAKERPLLFLRVRNPQEQAKVLQLDNVRTLDGLVYPKFCADNMDRYLADHPQDMWYMPILEKGIFDQVHLTEVRDFLLSKRKALLSVRIGITDILNSLNTRRNSHCTIYEIPVAAHIISRIVYAFVPHDINVTGVIWEHLGRDTEETLTREVREDMENGLFGKSAIHPSHVITIQRAYRVTRDEYETAKKILKEKDNAVFRENDTMQETKTHINWAKRIIKRRELYGLQQEGTCIH